MTKPKKSPDSDKLFAQEVKKELLFCTQHFKVAKNNDFKKKYLQVARNMGVSQWWSARWQLRECFESVSPNRAISILGSDHLLQILDDASMFSNFLGLTDIPCLSTIQYAEVLEAFRKHHSDQADSLFSLGVPWRTFPESGWVDQLVGGLLCIRELFMVPSPISVRIHGYRDPYSDSYGTISNGRRQLLSTMGHKFPLEHFEIRPTPDSNSEVWATRSPSEAIVGYACLNEAKDCSLLGKAITLAYGSHESIGYLLENAAFLRGLGFGEEKQLSAIRGTLHSFKLAVLAKCTSVLRGESSPGTMWELMSELLQRDFDQEMALVIMRIEAAERSDMRIGSTISYEPGGFMGLVQLVSLAENTLLVNQLGSIRSAFNSIKFSGTVRSFFEICDSASGEATRLLFAKKLECETEFSNAAQSSLNKFIELLQKLRVRVYPASVVVPKESAMSVTELLNECSRKVMLNWEKAKPKLLLQWATELEAPRVERDANEFCKSDKMWTIRFQGSERCVLDDRKGFSHLQALLQSPNQEFSYQALYSRSNGGFGESITDERVVDGGLYSKDISTRFLDTGNINSDNQDTIARYKEQIAKYRELKNNAENAEKVDLAQSIDKKVQALEDEVRRLFSVPKRARAMPPEVKKMKDNLSKNMSRAIMSLASTPETKLLGEHLQKYIKFEGSGCAYRPDKSIIWLT